MARRAKEIDWNAELRLGQMMDKTIAEDLGVTEGSVRYARKQRGIPAFISPRIGSVVPLEVLGSDSDPEVARKFEITASAVGYSRRKAGVAGFDTSCQADWATLPLGKVADCEISALLGCSNGTVARHRTRLGILPCYATKRSNPLHSVA